MLSAGFHFLKQLLKGFVCIGFAGKLCEALKRLEEPIFFRDFFDFFFHSCPISISIPCHSVPSGASVASFTTVFLDKPIEINKAKLSKNLFILKNNPLYLT